MFTASKIESLDAEHRERARALLAVDEMVADVYAALENAGELENTYLFFTSDNGYKEGQHRLQGKWTAYEEDIRVPLLVHGPGVPAGRRLDHMVLNNDLAPTFAELGGAEPAHTVDGRSMVPLLGPDTPDEDRWRERFLVENFRSEFPRGTPSKVPGYAAVRTRDTVYIEHRTEPEEHELYDLEEDPHQLQSLHRTADPESMRKLQEQLSQLSECRGSECRAAEGR